MTTIRRNNLAPFWWLLVLVLVDVAFFTYTIRLILSRYPDSDMVKFSSPLFIQGTITIAVLIAECIIYYLLRNKQLTRLWVRLHISMLYAALAVLPILYSIALIFIRPEVNDLFGYQASVRTLLSIRMIMYWTLVVLAHVFFIMTLKRGFFHKPQNEAPDGEEGILDDFRTVK